MADCLKGKNIKKNTIKFFLVKNNEKELNCQTVFS